MEEKEKIKEKKMLLLTGEEKKVIKELDNIKVLADKTKENLINNIKILNNPKKITKEFLRTKKLIPRMVSRIKRRERPIERNLQEPILLLMKENGYTEPIENVKSGDFIIATPNGEKSILLSPDKLTTLKYGNQYLKCWVAYENCMSPYPEQPIHSAEMYRKTTQKLSMNWRDRDEAKVITAKTKMWILIILAIGIALVLLFSTEFGRGLLSGLGGGNTVATAKAVAKTAVEKTPETASKLGGIVVK